MKVMTNSGTPRSVTYPDLPNGWNWWSGDASRTHYTHWFGTQYRQGGDLIGVDDSIGGFEGEVYWDKGGDGHHHVAIYPVTGIREDGDPQVSEYATTREHFDTKQEAVNAVPRLIRELKDQAQSND